MKLFVPLFGGMGINMKLMYNLPQEDESAYLSASEKGEKRMYCLPYDIEDTEFVKGYMVFTDRAIYKINKGQLLYREDIAKLSEFTTEMMYGSVGFYAKRNGSTVLLCRFISGRNLPRYSVVMNGCEIIADEARKRLTQRSPALVSDEAERYCPKCNRPFLLHTKICPFCRNKKEMYGKLWGMTRGMRFMLFVPLLTAIVSMIIRFILPFFQKVAINDYIQNSNRGDDYLVQFGIIIAAIVTLDIVHRGVNVISARVAAISGNKFTRTLRTILFEKIEMLSMNSISAKTTGDLMGRINNDVNVVQHFITQLLPTYVAQLFSFVIALMLLMWLNPLMCLFVFIPLPIAIVAISLFSSNMRRRHIHSWLLGQKTNHVLQDVLNGIRVVKSYGNEEREVSKFEKTTWDQSKLDEENAKLFDTVFPILGFVVRFGSYLILMYGNYRLFNGMMDIGTLNQFNSYANIIYEPIMQITQIPRNISNFFTSLSKIFEIMDEEPDVRDADFPQMLKIKGDVEIKDVTFGYETYNPVLRNINLSVKSGEMIGLVGHSGCGKTTLVNLIMRLYEVTSGCIEIDGVDIRDISQNILRTQIGVVLQETHLFSGSIRENIRYSKPHATNEEVVNAAISANAHEFIVRLPEGYNTMVGEKGYSLSGGERQRIAIARALIHNPKILILDEATAALDTETEKLIQDALNKLSVGRTTFAIAHRLSTLRNADKILVLDHGRAVEYGTHRELLDSKGHYYRLVMAQKRAAQEGRQHQDE